MSETENPLDARRLPFVVIIVGIIVLGGFSGVIAQGGGGAGTSTIGVPIALDGTGVGGQTPKNTGASGITLSETINPTNQTIIVATAAVACLTVCATTVPHVISVTDTNNDVFVDRIDLTNKAHFSLWTAPVLSTTANKAINIGALWNQTTIGRMLVLIYDNVRGIGTIQSNVGSGTAGNFTITTQQSGSVIVGSSLFNNQTQVSPNVAPLVKRQTPGVTSTCFKNPPPYPCVGSDMEDTLGTQLVNSFPFFYSSKEIGSAVVPQFVQGAVELTPILTEPNDQGSEGSGQISFDQAQVTNTTSVSVATLTSAPFTISPNETMIVTTQSSLGNANVTSVSDTAPTNPTVFTFITRQGTSGNGFLEVWAGRYTGFTTISDTLTVTWNTPDAVMFVTTLYRNVLGIGSVNGTATASAVSTLSTTLTTLKSGSWIFGTGGLSAGSASCQQLSSGTGFVQRTSSCTGTSGMDMDFMTVADNATVLPAIQKVTYTINQAQTTAMDMAEIELLAVDREPQNPNFNNFCTATNGVCVTTQYSINYVAKSTGVNALNQVLAPATAYCTGITTFALTTSAAPKALEAWGSYGGVSLNTTGLKMNVEVIISTTVPQTTFGTGASCTLTNTVATIYFAVSGTLSASNSFVTSLAGTFNAPAANTVYYASITIAPYGFAGHANFDQVVNQAYSLSTISMIEIK